MSFIMSRVDIFRCLWVFVKLYWKNLLLITWPIVCLPVMIGPHSPWSGEEGRKFRLIYCICLMAVFWVFEVIPNGLTAAMPIFLFPLLSILSAEKTTPCYMTKISFLFLGCFGATLAVEESRLSVRIALLTVKLVGAHPRRLHFGITTVSFFLSMWMNNVPCFALIYPIVRSILEELEKQGIGRLYKDNDEKTKRLTTYGTSFFLGLCYAITLGGSSSLIGNILNVMTKLIVEKVCGESDVITFTTWLLFFTPMQLIVHLFGTMWIQILYLGLFRPNSANGKMLREAAANIPDAYKAMMDDYENLGKATWYENWILAIYGMLLVLWFTRKPALFTGWSDLLAPKWDSSMHDSSVPAVFALILLFVLPLDGAFLKSFSKDEKKRPKRRSKSMMSWELIHKKMPWDLFFIIGAGMSIAKAARENETKLATLTGDILEMFLKRFHPNVGVILIIFINTIISEVFLSSTIMSVVVPGLAHMSLNLGLNPLYFCMAAFVGCIYTYLVPVSTPTNMYATSILNIDTFTMVKTGIVIKIVANLVAFAVFPTYGRLFFDYADFPKWAQVAKDRLETTK